MVQFTIKFSPPSSSTTTTTAAEKQQDSGRVSQASDRSHPRESGLLNHNRTNDRANPQEQEQFQEPEPQSQSKSNKKKTSSSSKKKRHRRRRKAPTSRTKVEPLPKKHHDAPMTKRDLYFALHCELVMISGGSNKAVARVTLVNWELEVVLDTFVQVPVPVTSFLNTGITPSDVRTGNPHAMSFACVRQLVEQTLRGKILIGHKLSQHLTALGLSHPPTDVRDTSKFQRFVSCEDGRARRLGDLSVEFLQRPLPEIGSRNRPVESCIAALDLYKSRRPEWEEGLIRKAQAKPESEYSYSPSPPTQPQQYYHVQQQQQQQQAMPHNVTRQRYEDVYPHSMAEQGYPQQPSSNSSWFPFGRKERYPQQMPPSATGMSYQAMQVLTSQYDFYDSSTAHDGSTNFEDSTARDVSTDYGSSRPYDGSSLLGESAATESIVSSLHEELHETHDVQQPSPEHSSWRWFGSRKSKDYSTKEGQRMAAVYESEESIPEEPSAEALEPHLQERTTEDSVELTMYALSLQEPMADHLRQPSESSSWRWFGSRKSRSYPNQVQKDQIAAAEEPIETSNEESLARVAEPEPEGPATLTANEAARDGVPDQASGSKHSSKWFGFRRSKSPSVGKHDKESQHSGEEANRVSPLDRSGHIIPLPEFDTTDAEASHDATTETTTPKLGTSPEKSSWFRLKRLKSPKRRSSNVNSEPFANQQATPQSESTDTNDEAWLQEVMNRPHQPTWLRPLPSPENSWLDEAVSRPTDSSSLRPAWLDYQKQDDDSTDSPSSMNMPAEPDIKYNGLFLRPRIFTRQRHPQELPWRCDTVLPPVRS